MHDDAESATQADHEGGWPSDVEVPLRGDFVDFGELTVADLYSVADELDATTGWGLESAADAGQPTTEARLWRALAAKAEAAGVERVADLAHDVRVDAARQLMLPSHGWALYAGGGE